MSPNALFLVRGLDIRPVGSGFEVRESGDVRRVGPGLELNQDLPSRLQTFYSALKTWYRTVLARWSLIHSLQW